MAVAPASTAASATLTEPNTLVLTPSPQSCSSSGTCLSAAAWNTMSGLKSFSRRMMRSRSRTSASRPSILGRRLLGLQRLLHGVERGLRILHDQQPRRTEGHDAVADLRADRAAAAGDDDRLALQETFEPAVVDLHARPQQQILDRDRRELQCLPVSSSDGSRLIGKPEPPRLHQDRFGAAAGIERRRRQDQPRHRRLALAQQRDDVFEIVEAAEHRHAANVAPWSERAGDSRPTGQIFEIAPLSIARSGTSTSAARPRISVGMALTSRARRCVRASRK